MLSHFWDIESLDNVFTLANFKETENEVDIYLLLDDIPIKDVKKRLAKLENKIRTENENFTGKINLFDLSSTKSIIHLAKEFGLSTARYINDKNNKDNYINCFPEFRLVCDTDPEYDPDKHPYLFGYNSYNYDTTMLAYFLAHAITFRVDNLRENQQKYVNDKQLVEPSQLFTIISPPTANEMRIFNNHLFEPQFIDQMPSILVASYNEHEDEYSTNNKDFNSSMNLIRKNMLMSGRHIDVARLNEKQKKVALKRLLGMMGHQILESDKLSGDKTRINTIDELFDLIAYNVSDVVNLAELFHEYAYTSAFTLKKGLLKTYPELIYRKKENEYAPDIAPDKVRNDRLTIDSSSAQFATRTLCPYDHLTDIPTVSFDYPAKDKADELGIPRLNILEETKKFFYANFPQKELRERFDIIYNYYKEIEGKNFNNSKNYVNDFGKWDATRGEKVLADELRPHDIMKIPKVDTCLPYFDGNGLPTSCFVTFSTGGIHGAEYNKELYDADMKAFRQTKTDMEYVKSVYPNPIDLKIAKRITMPDGTSRPAGDFLKSGSTMKKAFYKDIERKRPVLFAFKDDGSTKIHPKYVYTSSDDANHEDFTSYYPNLLRMMQAFYNPGLGYDRYGEVFEQKSTYGKLMKDESVTKEKRDEYKVLREGVKLILNSASGAGDATFESNIRMNNQIISMRIIGQLFSYRIGQAQALKGAI